MFNFTAVQGEAIKRAGQIDVNVKIDNNQPVEVKIRQQMTGIVSHNTESSNLEGTI